MKVHKFFYLTVQGDDLNLEEAQDVIKLPCRILKKGEVYASQKFGATP